MKRFLMVIFLIMILVSISSCKKKENSEPDKPAINAFFLNTGYVNRATSNTFKIKSRDDLDEYINESIYLIENVSAFNQKTAVYDDEYFALQGLIIIVFKEISSSYQYQVLNYELDEELVLNIEIKRFKPSNADEKKSGWHLVLEIEKSTINKAQFINFKFKNEDLND